jgi:hypothetical protein
MDHRYASGLEQLRGGSLWCALAGAGVTDKRVKSVCDALRSPNAAVTSLDLSGNRLTDAGAAALAAALGGGAAPDLIALNVAGNPLTDTGRAALHSLARLRRGLDVTFVVPDIITPVGPSSSSGGGGGSAGSSRPRLPHTGKSPSSGMAARFFGAADDGEGGADSPSARMGLGGRAPGAPAPSNAPGASQPSALDAAQAALSAASAAVAGAAAGEPDALHPAALGAALFAAVVAVEEELSSDAHASGDGGAARTYPRLSSLPPATLTLAQGAEVLVAVLALAPPPAPWQGGAGLRPGIGTHRLAALQLLCRFVSLGCGELDALLAGQALVPRAVALLFEHPCSSAAHTAAARLVQAALGSACTPLWLPAFADSPLGDALQARLAAAGVAAAPLPPGSRAPHVGAVIAIANGLRALEAGPRDACAAPLRDALVAHAEWQAFCEGALEALNEQQAGGLCGPKPMRPLPPYAMGGGGAASPGGGGGGGGAGGGFGGLMSGRELLAMLQTFSRMSTQS